MVVSFSAFREYNIQLKLETRCSDLRDHTVRIVPSRLNWFRFDNHRRSLPGRLYSSSELGLQQREANVKFDEKSSVVGR